MIAKPFLKWAGGKTQLIEQMTERFPQGLIEGKTKKFVEPFIGGGALFFHVIQKYNIEEAYISDLNVDLVITYNVIKYDVEGLIEALKAIQAHYYKLDDEKRQEYFYLQRNRFNELKGVKCGDIGELEIEKASLLIFLNRTCFNGLYRVNSGGYFNVSFGRYKAPKILDEENLRAVHEVLQRATIKCADYKESISVIDENTFVYFDPPYRPINITSSFNEYAGDFKDKHQRELGQYFKKLDKEKNAFLMLSNSDPKNHNEEDNFFDDMFDEYHIKRVTASRRINSKSESRGKITEILVTNY